ncbi:unnamed protein product, partial [Cladocopium goreaui]
ASKAGAIDLEFFRTLVTLSACPISKTFGRPMAEMGVVGSLGGLLEMDPDIRQNARQNKQLTEWPTRETIGIPSCRAIGCNLRLLTLACDWWAKHQETPKTVPVDILREEDLELLPLWNVFDFHWNGMNQMVVFEGGSDVEPSVEPSGANHGPAPSFSGTSSSSFPSQDEQRAIEIRRELIRREVARRRAEQTSVSGSAPLKAACSGAATATDTMETLPFDTEAAMQCIPSEPSPLSTETPKRFADLVLRDDTLILGGSAKASEAKEKNEVQPASGWLPVKRNLEAELKKVEGVENQKKEGQQKGSEAEKVTGEKNEGLETQKGSEAEKVTGKKKEVETQKGSETEKVTDEKEKDKEEERYEKTTPEAKGVKGKKEKEEQEKVSQVKARDVKRKEAEAGEVEDAKDKKENMHKVSEVKEVQGNKEEKEEKQERSDAEKVKDEEEQAVEKEPMKEADDKNQKTPEVEGTREKEEGEKKVPEVKAGEVKEEDHMLEVEKKDDLKVPDLLNGTPQLVRRREQFGTLEDREPEETDKQPKRRSRKDKKEKKVKDTKEEEDLGDEGAKNTDQEKETQKPKRRARKAQKVEAEEASKAGYESKEDQKPKRGVKTEQTKDENKEPEKPRKRKGKAATKAGTEDKENQKPETGAEPGKKPHDEVKEEREKKKPRGKAATKSDRETENQGSKRAMKAKVEEKGEPQKKKARGKAAKTKDTKGEEAQNEGKDDAKPVSFGRRPCPVTQPSKDRWEAIRDAFNEIVKPQVTQHSKLQVKFWEACVDSEELNQCGDYPAFFQVAKSLDGQHQPLWGYTVALPIVGLRFAFMLYAKACYGTFDCQRNSLSSTQAKPGSRDSVADKVFRQFFWMRHHKGPSPKRTVLLSSIKQANLAPDVISAFKNFESESWPALNQRVGVPAHGTLPPPPSMPPVSHLDCPGNTHPKSPVTVPDTPSYHPDNQLGLQDTQVATPTPVATPAATPRRAVPVTPQSLAYHDDLNLPRPSPGSLHLSKEAIDQRLRRAVTPRANGAFKISADVIKMYKDGGKSRDDVFRMFQACGFDVETFKVEVDILKQEYTDSNLKVEAEYVSEATMTDEWGWSQKRVAAVIAYCKTNPAVLMRQDRYEDIVLYWAERHIKASLKKGSRTEINRRLRWTETAGVEDFDLGTDSRNGLTDHPESLEGAPVDLTKVPDPTDPTKMIHKTLGVPELLKDAVPSSIAHKMMSCLEKRAGKMADLHKKYQESGLAFTDIQKRLIKKLDNERLEKEAELQAVYDISVKKWGPQKNIVSLLDLFGLCSPRAIAGVELEGRMRQAMPKLPAAKRPRERGEAPGSPRAKAKAKATAACAKRAPKVFSSMQPDFKKKLLLNLLQMGSAAQAQTRKRKHSCDCCPQEPSLKKFCGEDHGAVPVSNACFALHNYKEHSFLTRFVMFCLPCATYKAFPTLVPFLLDLIAKDLRRLFFEGIEIEQHRIVTPVCLGLKADIKFHHYVANFSRWYTRMGRTTDAEYCHECLAGRAGMPAEDISERPSWERTIFTIRPWRAEPVLSQIPFDGNRPEQMYRRNFLKIADVMAKPEYKPLVQHQRSALKAAKDSYDVMVSHPWSLENDITAFAMVYKIHAWKHEALDLFK